MNIIDTVVFADGPGGGNPCPVVLEADALNKDEMMKLAKEKAVEVGFILHSEKSNCDYNFKFFVPNREMEMCVHATIACVTVLRKLNLMNKNELTIETLAGDISVMITEDLTVHVKQGDIKEQRVKVSKEHIAKVLNINVNQLKDSPVVNMSTSRYKTLIQLDNEQTLNELQPDFKSLWKLCDEIQSTGLYPFVTDGYKYIARQFPNNTGYNEDPATGVAASALGAYVGKYINPDCTEIIVHQGIAMNKPSKIVVEKSEQSNCIIGKAQLL